jgi:hypothetical protein
MFLEAKSQGGVLGPYEIGSDPVWEAEEASRLDRIKQDEWEVKNQQLAMDPSPHAAQPGGRQIFGEGVSKAPARRESSRVDSVEQPPQRPSQYQARRISQQDNSPDNSSHQVFRDAPSDQGGRSYGAEGNQVRRSYIADDMNQYQDPQYEFEQEEEEFADYPDVDEGGGYEQEGDGENDEYYNQGEDDYGPG